MENIFIGKRATQVSQQMLNKKRRPKRLVRREQKAADKARRRYVY